MHEPGLAPMPIYSHPCVLQRIACLAALAADL